MEKNKEIFQKIQTALSAFEGRENDKDVQQEMKNAVADLLTVPGFTLPVTTVDGVTQVRIERLEKCIRALYGSIRSGQTFSYDPLTREEFFEVVAQEERIMGFGHRELQWVPPGAVNEEGFYWCADLRDAMPGEMVTSCLIRVYAIRKVLFCDGAFGALHELPLNSFRFLGPVGRPAFEVPATLPAESVKRLRKTGRAAGQKEHFAGGRFLDR